MEEVSSASAINAKTHQSPSRKSGNEAYRKSKTCTESSATFNSDVDWPLVRFWHPAVQPPLFLACTESFRQNEKLFGIRLKDRQSLSATLGKCKADWRYWNDTCRKPDGQTEISRHADSPWSQVQQFRREPTVSVLGEDTATENNDVTENSIPSDIWIQEYWTRNAINAVSVHIEGKKRCLVTIPVAAQPLCEVPPENMQEGDPLRPNDLTWLARLLARCTSKTMQETKVWNSLERDLGCLIF